MRALAVLSITLVGLGLGSCTRQEADEGARKAGKSAHELAIESEKAAKKAANELNGMAKEAKKGWTEADREKSKK